MSSGATSPDGGDPTERGHRRRRPGARPLGHPGSANDKRLLEVFASEWHGVLDDARERLEPVVVQMCGKWKVEPPSSHL